jgi:arsenate reductase
MADVTIWHNPNCSTSRYAVELAAELGVAVDERRYLLVANRPTRDEVVALLDVLEDPPSALVRRDATFDKLGLADDDVDTAAKVADVLAATPSLLQRPVLVAKGRAIIGRPKDRVAPFLEAARG